MRWLVAIIFASLPCVASLCAEEVRVPLKQGLVFVYAGFDPQTTANHPPGDMERLVSINQISADQLTLQIQFSDYASDPKLRQRAIIEKQVRMVDMDNAHRLLFRFLYDDPENLPGSTLFHASKAVLNDLIKTGKSAVVFAAGPPGEEGLFAATSRKYFRGDLAVVEPNAPIDVLVNGRKISVPTVHARGTLAVADLSYEVDFWWSLDPDNPLLVRFQQKEGNWIQIVRIDYPADPPPSVQVSEKVPSPQPAVMTTIDAQLSGPQCRAEMHGVYFDFGSATLLPASAPALKEVGDLLAKHKDWTSTVEGHTDNVGSAAYNLDLSNRRAAAVREELVTQYSVGAAQLNATGFGETRPVDSNETPVGRAHNRRVELSRNCAR